jgi:hypothetical protein
MTVSRVCDLWRMPTPGTREVFFRCGDLCE